MPKPRLAPVPPALVRPALGCLAALLCPAPPAPAQVALSPATVQVPASMAAAPFDSPRTLNVPANFTVAVYARVPGARFLAVTPDGGLLVSQPGAGKISLVRPNAGGDPLVSDFATGLSLPHDMVFHAVGGVTYLYVSESKQVDRFPYNSGDLTAHDKQVIVSGLPDASNPELKGAYAHALKNIALDGNDKLYVSIGSATNADPSDTTASPQRAAIYQFNADGTGGRLFAQGLRNAEGLAIVPGTTDNLWAAVNNRDNLAYPFHADWDGDGTDDYGKVIQSYVDNHPPEEFTHVRDGGNYGWPFANPDPDTSAGLDNMPIDLDVQNNADGSHGAVTAFDRISKGIQAHSAPLGLTFLGATAVPAPYRQGALIALHGSWNRAQKTGYKVIYFPWDTANQAPGAQADFVTGWLDAGGGVWGRPVDTAVDAQGALLVSDDNSGTVYKLTYTPPAAGAGLGLRGDYFNAEDVSSALALSRVDGGVNFDWGSGSPAPAVHADSFSARWTGQVRAQAGGAYTFSTVSDDGVRLWVNGQKVVDNWTLHGPTTNTSAAVTLAAGQKYDIKLEYYEHTGGAVARLLWTPPGGSAQAIPKSQLSPSAAPVDLSAAFTLDGFAPDASPGDGNLDGGGYSYSATLMPPAVLAGSLPYTLGPAAGGQKNVVTAAGQSLALPAGSFRSLTFLAAAVNGDQTGAFTVGYGDGTGASSTVALTDWCFAARHGEGTALTLPYRNSAAGRQTITNHVFAYTLPLDPARTTARLSLPSNANIKLLAVTLAP